MLIIKWRTAMRRKRCTLDLILKDKLRRRVTLGNAVVHPICAEKAKIIFKDFICTIIGNQIFDKKAQKTYKRLTFMRDRFSCVHLYMEAKVEVLGNYWDKMIMKWILQSKKNEDEEAL